MNPVEVDHVTVIGCEDDVDFRLLQFIRHRDMLTVAFKPTLRAVFEVNDQ